MSERGDGGVQRLHEERMGKIEREQADAQRALRVLAEQIRLLRRAVGLPPDLTEVG